MSSFKNIISANPEQSNFSGASSSNENEKFEIANKLFPKEKDPSISKLLNILQETPSEDITQLSKLHVQLMKVYYENRNLNPNYTLKSSYHAKEALIYGDSTGMAAYRLLKNLAKEKKIYHAIEVCSIVTDAEYQFSENGFKKQQEFAFIMKKLKRKIQSKGKIDDKLFNEEEVKMIMRNTKKM